MMTLAELGEILREERVRRGYSVEDVASTVKITSRVVRAIEEGDESSLPHAVYACGFIKAYAAFVGVDENDVRPALATLCGPQEEPQAVTLAPPTRSAERRAGGGMLSVVVVCAALAFGIFWFRAPLAEVLSSVMSFVQEQGKPSRATPAEAPLPAGELNAPQEEASSSVSASEKMTGVVPPAQADSVSGTGATQLTNSSAPLTSGQNSTSAGMPASGSAAQTAAPQRTGTGLSADGLPTNLDPSTINAMSGTPTDSDTPGSASQPVRSTFGETAPVTPADSTLTLLTDETARTDVTRAGQGKHQIVISALEECWVHSSADGTFTRQFSLKKGETFALSFENRLVVKLGNAGGVRIKYDGEEMPAPGKSGQVRTITFPPTAEVR